MFLRLLFILVLVFWVVPLVMRALGRGRTVPREGAGKVGRKPEDHLERLSRQDISDADFEELPPDK